MRETSIWHISVRVTHFQEAGLTAWTDLSSTNELLPCSLPANRRRLSSQTAKELPLYLGAERGKRSPPSCLFSSNLLREVIAREGEGGFPGDVSPLRLIGRVQTDRVAVQSEGCREATQLESLRQIRRWDLGGPDIGVQILAWSGAAVLTPSYACRWVIFWNSPPAEVCLNVSSQF